MIFRYLLKIYIYVVGYICPSLLNNKLKNDDAMAIEIDKEDYNISDHNILDHNIYDDYYDNFYDNYDDYIDKLNKLDKTQCEYTYNYYDTNYQKNRNDQPKHHVIHINNAENEYHSFVPLVKSQSMKIHRHICGYCNNHIGVPTFMYLDNTYCNTTCRDRQIKLDKNKKTRIVHSYSM